MEVDFIDITDRVVRGEQRKIDAETRQQLMARPDLVFSYDGTDYDLSISGLSASEVTHMSLVSPSGQQYPLHSLAIGTNLYQLSSLQSGYYTIVVQYTTGVITENIHLQH